MRILSFIKEDSRPAPFDFGIPASKHTENIGALRMVFTNEEFVSWLNAPNKHLADLTPRHLIENGEAEIVADLAEAMLTGCPL